MSYDGLDTVYIIGGYTGGSAYSKDVLKYSLSLDTIEVVGQLLQGVERAFAGSDGTGNHYIIGGRVYLNSSPHIYKFQEGRESVVTVVGTLPEGPSRGMYLNLPQPKRRDSNFTCRRTNEYERAEFQRSPGLH